MIINMVLSDLINKELPLDKILSPLYKLAKFIHRLFLHCFTMQFFTRLLRFKERVVSLHLFPLLLTFSLSAINVQGAEQPIILGSEGNISVSKRYPLSGEQYYSPNPYAEKRITSISAIVIDPVRNLTLFAKAPDVPRQPASTIKVLTGTIALEALSGDEAVTISANAASRPSSKMYLDPKKEYLADDLISGVLLASANDASVAIAELISGSEENFTKLMNRLAKDWGATNTDCRTATGLTAKNQKSTSRDLALIFKHAMQSEEFAERIKRRAMQTVDGKKFYNHKRHSGRSRGPLEEKRDSLKPPDRPMWGCLNGARRKSSLP